MRIRVVKFGCSEEDFPFAVGDKIDAAVRISVNPYNGREYLSVQAADIKRNGIDDEKYFSEKSVYELFSLNRNNDTSVFPGREICSVIYKFLKSKGEWRFGFDELYFSLNQVTYGQLKFALKAFEQSGLIAADNHKITVCRVDAKVDLMNTSIMKELKGRLNRE